MKLSEYLKPSVGRVVVSLAAVILLVVSLNEYSHEYCKPCAGNEKI